MAYGHMTPEMRVVLREHVVGAEVWDLGAGSLGRAREMLEMGASRVLAVDKGQMPASSDSRLETHITLFLDLPPPEGGIDVAFLGWPQNSSLLGLTELLVRSRKVVYLGSNTNGSACGNSSLFTHFSVREVLAHVPHTRNSLIVYGGWLSHPRKPLPEEWAALHPEHLWSFEEAVEAVRER